jgi:hypothetical protein
VYDTTSYDFEFNGTGDLLEQSLSFFTETFMPLESSAAAGILPSTLPAGYPTLDFYGAGIPGGGAAGAVQISSAGITINNIIPKDKGIEVYPNPVAKGGVLTVEVPSGTQKVLLYDMVGHLLQTYPLSNNRQETTLQLPAALPHGIYVLRADGRMCKFVVVE